MKQGKAPRTKLQVNVIQNNRFKVNYIKMSRYKLVGHLKLCSVHTWAFSASSCCVSDKQKIEHVTE